MVNHVLRAAIVVAVSLSLFALVSESEVLVFTDGTSIAVEALEREGTTFAFVDGAGTRHTVPSAVVDAAATETANRWWRLPTLWAAEAPAAAATVQDGDGSIAVTDQGAPAAGVDIFLFANQGKQPIGTTNTAGQLPFDPALLTGKVRVTVAVRECPERTEVYLVSVETDDACREAEDASDEPDCDCEVAGAIWWGSSMSIDVSTLTIQGGSAPIASNPLLWIGAGAAGGTAIIVATGGDDDSSTSGPSTTPPVVTTPPTTTTTTSVPPMEPETMLPGMYGCDLDVISNPSNHPDLLGNMMMIDVRQQGDMSSVFANRDDFIEAHGPFMNNRQDLRGEGRYAGFPTTAEWMGTFNPGTGGRADIQGEYAIGTNGSLPGGGAIRWRFNCSK